MYDYILLILKDMVERILSEELIPTLEVVFEKVEDLENLNASKRELDRSISKDIQWLDRFLDRHARNLVVDDPELGFRGSRNNRRQCRIYYNLGRERQRIAGNFVLGDREYWRRPPWTNPTEKEIMRNYAIYDVLRIASQCKVNKKISAAMGYIAYKECNTVFQADWCIGHVLNLLDSGLISTESIFLALTHEYMTDWRSIDSESPAMPFVLEKLEKEDKCKLQVDGRIDWIVIKSSGCNVVGKRLLYDDRYLTWLSDKPGTKTMIMDPTRELSGKCPWLQENSFLDEVMAQLIK